ncbi:hypothetical protein GCM10008904_10140 [Paraclostridium ghonii]|uniref:Phage-related protein n=1 Tax=Paraclostridium ghonii TaxID=29358 RepID=A0ABU0MYG3_9FIRM|nr:hypothetical protein [Paeniclostridium ghonii]MDQ0555957.1 phage-related protein [Paeniclostridium ghonii]
MSQALGKFKTDFKQMGKDVSSTLSTSFKDLKKSIEEVNAESKKLDNSLSNIKPDFSFITNQIGGLKGALITMGLDIISSLFPTQEITKQLEEVKEKIITLLKPIADKISGFIGEGMIAAKDAILSFCDSISNVIGKLSEYKSVLETVGQLLAILAVGIAAYVVTQNLAAIATATVSAIMSAYTIIVGIANTVTAAFGAIMAFITSPIGIITFAIMALFLVIKNWDSISAFLANVWAGICDIAMSIWGSISEFLTNLWTSVCEMAMTIWASIGEFFTTLWTGICEIAMSIWTGICEFLTSLWTSICEMAMTIWASIGEFFTTLWTGISSIAINIWSGISSFLSGIWSGISSAAIGIWSGVCNFLISIFTNISNFISTSWNGIQNIVTSVGSAIGSAVSNVFNGISTTVQSVMDKAKNIVSGAFDFIKGIFNAVLKPNIKLPHFDISGKFSLNPLQVPKLGISWYQTGGIFTGASVIGVGENGDEAVLPLSNKRRMKPFANAVASMIGVDNPNQQAHQGVTINIDNMSVRNDMDIKKIAEEINRLATRENRKLGII